MKQETKTSIDPNAARDITELRERITEFKKGTIPEERFKAFRLTRGVYGQRQPGVQMFRIKIPGGGITSAQLERIADLSDSYTNGNLHLTTRQDIQLHYIHLEDTPDLWHQLEEVDITTKEACGNTVRNITVSALAGVDPDEPFDVTPYALSTFRYFLRNPVCQEMGRKIKIAFSSGNKDTALTFLHDFGFIPKLRDGVRGFEVFVGGGLGAQAIPARKAFDFLETNQLIPFLEAALRVFDRYGEREKRFKARLKFLTDEKRGIGLEKFLQLVEEECNALKNKRVEIEAEELTFSRPDPVDHIEAPETEEYKLWLRTNVVPQKQEGLNVVKLQIPLGDLSSDNARAVANLVRVFGSSQMRITIGQGLYLLHIPTGSLPALYAELDKLNLAKYGAETLADITACPGTDTCNLGVTNSTAISNVLEDVIRKEYRDFVTEHDIHIKISGCMNSCGQHMIANIGFHGSSIKHDNKVVPALQVVIGGGIAADGEGLIADKIIKLPTKRIPDAIRLILDDYAAYEAEEEYFNRYYQHKGKRYFYDLLKSLANLETLEPDDYIDWGEELTFTPEIGVGECAGVMYDVVGTIIQDARDKVTAAHGSLSENRLADATYHVYSAFVIGAKALLLSIDVHCNTHIGIIQDFDKHFVETGLFNFHPSFQEVVLQKEAYNEKRTHTYLKNAELFLEDVIRYRQNQTEQHGEKEVIGNYYKA